MSERLTPKWTPTAREAFGVPGAKGDRGEAKVVKWLSDTHNVVRFADKIHQVAGIDIEVLGPGTPWTMDVKANIAWGGLVPIEANPTGWLFNPKKTSDVIWHVSLHTSMHVIYRRKDMQHYLMGRKASGYLVYLDPRLLSFVIIL